MDTEQHDFGQDDYTLFEDSSRLTALSWDRWKTPVWFLLWLLGIPVGMIGFLSVLFWAYGVDG